MTTYGPYTTSGGTTYWLRFPDDNPTFQTAEVGFDIDADPEPDVFVPYTEFMLLPGVDDADKAEVAAKVRTFVEAPTPAPISDIPAPTGINNRSNPYYQKRNHVKLARADSNRSEFFGTIGGVGGPAIVTRPVIAGLAAPDEVLSLVVAPVWDGTEVSTGQEWYVNGSATGVTSDTYTLPSVVLATDKFELRATATDDEGQTATSRSNTIVMVTPQLEIPDELLVEGSNTFDLADYAVGYVESYDATGAGVESISGSVVTVVNQAGVYNITCTASNPAGIATAVTTVRVVPTNEYVNAAFVGGAASGPSDGNNPPNNHIIGFNTINSAPIDNGDGTFSWEINPLGETGRSYLAYSMADNHPDLRIGDSITLSWKLRDFTGTRTIALTASSGSLNNVDLLYGNQRTVPNSLATVQVTATVTELPFEAQFRIGVGPTTDRAEYNVISDPIAFIVDPPDTPTADMWTLEVA
jgi:hypothetical protein